MPQRQVVVVAVTEPPTGGSRRPGAGGSSGSGSGPGWSRGTSPRWPVLTKGVGAAAIFTVNDLCSQEWISCLMDTAARKMYIALQPPISIVCVCMVVRSCPRVLLPGIRRNRLRPCRAVLSQVACASGVVLPAVPRQHLLVHLLIVVHSLAFPWTYELRSSCTQHGTTVPKPNRVPRSTSLIHRCPRFTVIALKSLLPSTSSHSPPVITAYRGSSMSYPGLHLHPRSVGRLEPLQQGEPLSNHVEEEMKIFNIS
uniref:Uncharacterized protein n=1 Tax=Oryza nivara TaxID=4536 RepID=A0A0E0IVR5_ORYNI